MTALGRNSINLKIGQWQNDLEEGSYYQSWYPLHLAAELKPGTIVGQDFLGTRVIIYRDPSGAARVQSAYCPHVGADLSCGEIVDGEVRCAYHHWRFRPDGACTSVPTGDKIPSGARLFSYPTAEKWGLIWAFHGAEPLFDVPHMPGIEEDELIFAAGKRGERPIDHWLSTSNAFDFQHLRALHNLPDAAEPKELDVRAYSIEYGGNGSGPFRTHGLVTGTNTLALHMHLPEGEHFMLVSSAAVAPGRSLSFYVLGVRRPEANNPAARAAAEERLPSLIARAMKLYTEDEPVLYTIRFRGPAEGQWVGADRHLASYFRYLREFPQARAFDT